MGVFACLLRFIWIYQKGFNISSHFFQILTNTSIEKKGLSKGMKKKKSQKLNGNSNQLYKIHIIKRGAC